MVFLFALSGSFVSTSPYYPSPLLLPPERSSGRPNLSTTHTPISVVICRRRCLLFGAPPAAQQQRLPQTLALVDIHKASLLPNHSSSKTKNNCIVDDDPALLFLCSASLPPFLPLLLSSVAIAEEVDNSNRRARIPINRGHNFVVSEEEDFDWLRAGESFGRVRSRRFVRRKRRRRKKKENEEEEKKKKKEEKNRRGRKSFPCLFLALLSVF